jgi:N6-adenosine-specific RNA methylase IME4
MTFREIIELLPDAPTWCPPPSVEGWPPLPWLEMRAVTRLSSKANALKALNAMERELDSPRTYTQIRRTLKVAQAFKLMAGDVAEVKQKAEWVILIGNQRIGAEIAKVKKASGGDRKSKLPRGGDLKSGREATGIPHTSRSRLQKLANIERDKLKAMAEEMWDSGKDATVKGVLGEAKEAEIRKERADYEKRREQGGTVADLEALAASGYRAKVVYVDAPWEFKVYSGKGQAVHAAERHYDVMSLDQIKALPVGKLATKDCALFLWGVNPELPGALEVIRAWGFEFKTVAFHWIKTTKNGEGIALDGKGLHWGMGHYTHSNIEPVLLATKGSPRRTAKDVHSVVIAPVGEHSVKPEEVRRRIERLYPGPYLELFSRRDDIKGWKTWGNEVPKKRAGR